MAHDIENETGDSAWTRVKRIAADTPASRNRYIDFLRAVSIGAVILGHWLIAAPYFVDGTLRLDHMLAVEPWSQWLTWVLQVMPVFFMVGGFANAASLSSARDKGQGFDLWIAGRLDRLVFPVIPLIAVWTGLAIIGHFAGVDPILVAAGSKTALIPIWFLSVYIMVVVAAPITYAAWRRFGMSTFWLLASCAVIIDIAAFIGGFSVLRWVNYGFVWLAVHQLGYLWQTDRAGSGLTNLLWCAGGLALMILLVVVAEYPVAMISVPGEDVSNSQPPTIMLIALACAQYGLLRLLEAPARRWLQDVLPWAVTILVNRSIMTLFLWHMTVMVLFIGFLNLLGGIGLTAEPGGAMWWITRPLWFAVLGALLAFLVVFLSPLEGAIRHKEAKPLAAWKAVVGASMLCLGLAQLALNGIGLAEFPWVRVWSVALVFVGAGLIVRLAPDHGARQK